MLKKCDLSRYTWLLLDRLLRLSHFCTRNAASLTVLDQALYCDGIPRSASRFYPPCSRQLSCLHGQRYYFVIHLPRMCTVTSRIREIFPCGIQNPGIQNTALGIRNPTNDWHPESKFHWQYLESGIHCVELMWQVLAVVNMLARLLLASCLRCLANLHSSFLFYFFFPSIRLCFTQDITNFTHDQRPLHAYGPRPLAILRGPPIRRFLGCMIEIKVFFFS